MRLTEYYFVNSQIGADVVERPDPEKPGETMRVKRLRIQDPEKGETFYFLMGEDVARQLVKELSGGIEVPTMAIPGGRLH